MGTSIPRRLFRIVRSDPPTLRDFMSHAALGKQPRRPLSRREQDLWRGVSVYQSASAAAEKARAIPSLGAFIAEVILPESLECRIEQTGRELEHHTVWESPDTLLTHVNAIVHVDSVE
jgi:hypothetical protein